MNSLEDICNNNFMFAQIEHSNFYIELLAPVFSKDNTVYRVDIVDITMSYSIAILNVSKEDYDLLYNLSLSGEINVDRIKAFMRNNKLIKI